MMRDKETISPTALPAVHACIDNMAACLGHASFASVSVRSWDTAGGEAMLKVRCETSRSSYAMYWERYFHTCSNLLQQILKITPPLSH